MNLINLYVKPSDTNASSLNETSTECLCTIYTTALECDEKTESYVYGWFFILLSIIAVLTATLYVVHSIQYLVRFMQEETYSLRRNNHHHQDTTHMH